MVDQQIRTWEVLDPRVLEALAAVPREAFVPADYRELAFADAPLPIGFGQSMLAPKIQGRILQALGVNPSDSALEVGTGTGYLSACLSLLGASTHSIDIHAEFTAVGSGQPARRAARRACGSRRATHSAQRRWASTTSLPSRDRCRFTMRASSRRCGSAAACSRWSALRPSWTRFWCAGSTDSEWIRESLFETVIDPLINATAAQGFVF